MSKSFQDVSNGMAQAVETAGASIVQVNARRRLPGSGIIWSEDGIVVSANHIVKRKENITVGLGGGDSVSATLIGRDPTTDLAVLKIEGAVGLKTPKWQNDIEKTKVGHLVLALGRPGQTVQATLGVVSAVGSAWRTHAGGKIDHYLQTDVLMYPGFSGGASLGAGGEILGLNSSALLRGVSVTTPASTVSRVVTHLLAHGRVKRGYLGVSTQPVRLPTALAEQLEQETGLLLVSVEVDSPAEAGGLLLGDTIVSLNDTPIRQHDDLLVQLGGETVGQTVTLKIIRGGQIEELEATVGERD